MKRKGFTLIELLAVIVVLAIIAIIAVPTILGVIYKARRCSIYRNKQKNILKQIFFFFILSFTFKPIFYIIKMVIV